METAESGNLNHPAVRKAFLTVAARAERVQDPEWLVATFVDNGVIDLVTNNNNQIIHGRRGTGKTHLLRVLAARLEQDPATAVVYIDARTLGSSLMFTDEERPLHARCLGLFKDVISLVHNQVLDRLVNNQTGKVDAALNTLAEIERQLNYTEPSNETKRSLLSNEESSRSGSGSSVGLNSLGPSVSANLKEEQAKLGKAEIEVTTSETPKVIIPALYEVFRRLLEEVELDQLVILIDEWASIPLDLQPYMAEFLNRVFFANPKITIKIAALEFRSSFVKYSSAGIKEIGLELGGDIETAIDLDDFYVYDRNPAGTEQVFGELLLRHFSANLDPNDYPNAVRVLKSVSDFRREFFTLTAFEALVRSAEGVARDLLQVASRSYGNAVRLGSNHITVNAVTRASQEWYEADKQQNLSEQQQALLQALISEVIGNRRARSFMIRREHSDSSPLLRSLIDQRVVHTTKKGYADKDNPGSRYNIYTLDYGCYVDLRNTQREPQGMFDSFESEIDVDEIIVPFDDNRSIRRVIVPLEFLLEPPAQPTLA